MSGRKWTAEEDKMLAELAAKGYTIKEAGRRIGRSYSAVNIRASNLKISFTRHTLTPEQEAEVAELYRTTSHNYSSLARLYGVTFAIIKGACDRQGVRRTQKPYFWTDEKRRELEALVIRGAGLPEIAAKLGVTECALKNELSMIYSPSLKKTRNFLKEEQEENGR